MCIFCLIIYISNNIGKVCARNISHLESMKFPSLFLANRVDQEKVNVSFSFFNQDKFCKKKKKICSYIMVYLYMVYTIYTIRGITWKVGRTTPIIDRENISGRSTFLCISF